MPENDIQWLKMGTMLPNTKETEILEPLEIRLVELDFQEEKQETD